MSPQVNVTTKAITASLLLLIAACATPTVELAPLEVRGSFPVDYSARLSREGLQRPGPEPVAPLKLILPPGVEDPSGGAPSPEEATARGAEEGQEADGMVDSHFRLVEVSNAHTEQLLPQREYGQLGWYLAEESSRRLLADLESEHLEASILTSPRLLTRSGDSGSIEVLDQFAFVEGFQLRFDGIGLLADPVVGSANEGLALTATVTSTPEGELDIALELQLVGADKPLPQAQVRVPGAAQDVTVQLPLFTHQSARAEATAQAGDSLLLGPIPSITPERSLFLLLSARSL